MRKVLKWLAIIVGGLLLLVLIVVGALYFNGSRKLAGPHAASPAALSLPSDPESLERGQRISDGISGCASCHGSSLEGEFFMDEPGFATVYAPNLTPGEGSPVSDFTVEDWLLALRYGIGSDGRALAFMPSQRYAQMSDEDMAALITYLQTVEPVDNSTPAREISFMAQALAGAGQLGLAVDQIGDHTAAQSVEAGLGVEYGEYLATIAVCQDCHAENYAGNSNPNTGPIAPNLTPGGELRGWSFEDFSVAMRTGVTPYGRQLSDEMPWDYYEFTDEELEAIWVYFNSLPELPTN